MTRLWHRMLLKHAFAPFRDVVCLPLVDRETALAPLQAVVAARTATA